MDVLCDPNTTAGQVFEVWMFASFINVKRCWYLCAQNKEFSSAGLTHFKSVSNCVLKVPAGITLVVIGQCEFWNSKCNIPVGIYEEVVFPHTLIGLCDFMSRTHIKLHIISVCRIYHFAWRFTQKPVVSVSLCYFQITRHWRQIL